MTKLQVATAGLLLFLLGCGSNSVSTSSKPVTSATSSTVSTTNNPQVASYTYQALSTGTVKIQFGTDTTYGRSTWSVPATAAAPVTILVAGMLANTTYHMQAIFTDTDGVRNFDADHTFATGALPASNTAVITAATVSGQTPQPGIELVNGIAGVVGGGLAGPVATDLSGNVIWTYPNADIADVISDYPVRLLDNGNILMLVSHSSSTLLANTTGIDTISEIRQVDLAGNTVQSLSITDLNTRLAAHGFTFTGGGFSHEILPLANGHFLTFVTTLKSVTLTGAATPTTVLGDVVVDLDPTWQPVWIWNSFDHLDVNRHPFNFPDWTHGNSIDYDAADSSIIISLRHQNWVLKLNYDDGAGDGSIIWHLGSGGDFTLLDPSGASDVNPADWFYSQHYAHLLTTVSSGVLNLSLMDNGDDRQFADGTSCPVTGGSTCYTTIPIFELDENAKTAKFLFHHVLDPSLYSFFGGNTELLANGHVEYDLAGLANSAAAIYEETDEAVPQPVWSLHVSGGEAYRGIRWPSLYPGVQW